MAAVLPGHIDFSVADRVHRLTASRTSTFWRGGEVAMDDLRTGDALLIRLAPDWTIERGWANLTRAHGTVSQASGSGYVIKAGDMHDRRAQRRSSSASATPPGTEVATTCSRDS